MIIFVSFTTGMFNMGMIPSGTLLTSSHIHVSFWTIEIVSVSTIYI